MKDSPLGDPLPRKMATIASSASYSADISLPV
jgi:hypothetical protein